MEVEFDPRKREETLRERGLDFAEAGKVFDGPRLTLEDARFDYPEPRFQTFGMLGRRMVIVVWTPSGTGIRVISMRKCNEREQRRYGARMG